MARIARTTKATTPAARERKPGRPMAVAATTAAKVKTSTITKRAVAASRAAAAPAPAPKIGKDELRTAVERLERANATLRAKGRIATKAAKLAAGRIAELEEQVVHLEQQLTVREAAARKGQAASPPKGRPGARGRTTDPDASAPLAVRGDEPSSAVSGMQARPSETE